ncbi:MAG: hypothetical protein IJM76_05990 [Lachnospiraceae bacterium]|nr:hypothetical protein [Lachnospiraceae bacterium]
MGPEMITALAAFVAAVGGIVSALLLHRKTVSLLELRLQIVERKLDDHNGYAEKFAEYAEKMADIQVDLAKIRTTLEFLKDGVHR